MSPEKKQILFIAPLPPPTSGHSIVSKKLYEYLSNKKKVQLVNLSHNSNSKGNFSFKRSLSILIVLLKVIIHSNKSESIYFTISESFLGNIKDLLIYFIFLNKLNKLVLHLHGGSLENIVFAKHPLLKSINYFFLKRIKYIIISGNSHKSIFKSIKEEKLVIVPNFAPKNIYIKEHEFNKKYENIQKIQFLFLSSMEESKGYKDLFDGIEKLPQEISKLYQFNFAGRFNDLQEEEIFKKKIRGKKNVRFYGFVEEKTKISLFKKSHIFCLPSKLLEGQPVSILEAYAAGCAIITTNKPGILDIFKDKTNGYLIKNKTIKSLVDILKTIPRNKNNLQNIAFNNLKSANELYTENNFCKNIEKLLN